MAPILLNTLFDDPAKKWLAIGAAMFLIAYFVLRPLAKRKQDPLSGMSSPGSGSISKQRSVEREMSNLLVELSEMARQVTAQLDTRATKLELLMREADEKIETLQRLQSSVPVGPSAPGSAAMPRQSAAAERDALMQPLHAQSTTSPHPPQPVVDPRYAEIYALADQGRSPVDIASRLGRPSGEVELILALRQ
ncbi:MAG TPA: hypothetical protein VGR35_18255 [Tepidisphaeraceae bacterium]|nr:hypothetical protein [Tepidisphaeraceae bacterium]